MIDKRSLKKISELRKSEDYQKDFEKIKRHILSGKLKTNEFISAYILRVGPEKEQRIETWSERVRRTLKAHPLRLPHNRIKEILEHGNINEHFIIIPNDFKKFKDRWDLDCFFNPSKGFPENFNPSHYRSPVIPCFPISQKRGFTTDKIWEIWKPSDLCYRMSDFTDPNRDDSKIYLEIDGDSPIEIIKKEVGRAIIAHKKAFCQVQRYSDKEIIEIRKFINDGMNAVQILKKIRPEYKGFKYTKHYVEGYCPPRYRRAPSELKRIQRMVMKMNEQTPK